MRNFLELIKDCLTDVREVMPWDMAARVAANPDLLIVDVREPYEFDAMHIKGSINVPRGVLEQACEWDHDETVPELARHDVGAIVVVDAVEQLVHRIWPLIRAAHPGATLAVAGADAPPSVRRLDGREGIRIFCPVEERAAHLRRVRVMLFPIRYGTGQLNKVLESAEAGCAIVATSVAMRGLGAMRSAVCVEDEPARFAARAADLLRSDREIRERSASARSAVERSFPRSATIAALRQIVMGEAG